MANPPADAGDTGLIPDLGRSHLPQRTHAHGRVPQLPGLRSAPQPGFIPGGGTTPRRRARLRTPVLTPGEFHEQRRLARRSPGGHRGQLPGSLPAPQQERPRAAPRAAATRLVGAKPLQRCIRTAKVSKRNPIKSLMRMPRCEHRDRKD